MDYLNQCFSTCGLERSFPVGHGVIGQKYVRIQLSRLLITSAWEYVDRAQQQDSHWIAYSNEFATLE